MSATWSMISSATKGHTMLEVRAQAQIADPTWVVSYRNPCVVSGRPRQLMDMCENMRCSILFHLLVPGCSGPAAFDLSKRAEQCPPLVVNSSQSLTTSRCSGPATFDLSKRAEQCPPLVVNSSESPTTIRSIRSTPVHQRRIATRNASKRTHVTVRTATYSAFFKQRREARRPAGSHRLRGTGPQGRAPSIDEQQVLRREPNGKAEPYRLHSRWRRAGRRMTG